MLAQTFDQKHQPIVQHQASSASAFSNDNPQGQYLEFGIPSEVLENVGLRTRVPNQPQGVPEPAADSHEVFPQQTQHHQDQELTPRPYPQGLSSVPQYNLNCTWV